MLTCMCVYVQLCACMDRCTCVCTCKARPTMGKPGCWISGLINTCLLMENGAEAPFCDSPQGGSFGFSKDHVSPSQPCCSEVLPVLGVGFPARVRPSQPGWGKRPAEIMSPCSRQGVLAGRDLSEQMRMLMSISPDPQIQACQCRCF